MFVKKVKTGTGKSATACLASFMSAGACNLLSVNALHAFKNWRDERQRGVGANVHMDTRDEHSPQPPPQELLARRRG